MVALKTLEALEAALEASAALFFERGKVCGMVSAECAFFGAWESVVSWVGVVRSAFLVCGKKVKKLFHSD